MSTNEELKAKIDQINNQIVDLRDDLNSLIRTNDSIITRIERIENNGIKGDLIKTQNEAKLQRTKINKLERKVKLLWDTIKLTKIF